MARPKVKESKSRSFRLRADLDERLEQYHDVSYIPKTVIMELALEEYLNRNMPKVNSSKKKGQ